MFLHTANQPFDLIAYRMNVDTGRTEAAKFCFHPQGNEIISTAGTSGVNFSDIVAFDEALEWVFGEYDDVMRNLAA